jgi:hypothetical protein
MPLSRPTIFTIHAAFTEHISTVDGYAALTCGCGNAWPRQALTAAFHKCWRPRGRTIANGLHRRQFKHGDNDQIADGKPTPRGVKHEGYESDCHIDRGHGRRIRARQRYRLLG